MLPPKNRLTKKKDFELVFSKGKSIKGNFLVVKLLENNLPASRFGFVVSKKVSSKATVRNKVRRRLREIISPMLSEINHSADIVIIALSGIEKKEFLQIKEVALTIFKKIP